jgi:hypothetical protein
MDELACEAELSWRNWGAIPIGRLTASCKRRPWLPPSIVALAASLERQDLVDDVAGDCDDQAARELTESMWRRAKGLGLPLPDEVLQLGSLPARAVVEILAAVVASGFRFDPAFQAIDRRSSLSRVFAHARRLGQLVRHRPVRIAEQATSGRVVPVVCLEFATAVRVLFYALKRSTGALHDAFVPAIYGAALDMDSAYSHAWNWLVDGQTQSIMAFDVSTVSRTPHDEIDLSRYRNISAFLGSIYCASSIGRDDVGELLHATIEPDTYRGQILLYHLAEHVAVPVQVRERIAAHLEASDFERVVPHWRERLARRVRELGRVGRWLLTTDDSDLGPLESLRLR